MAKWPKDNQSALITFYGDPARSVGGQLVKVTPPFKMYYDGKPVKTISFHTKAAGALATVLGLIWDYYGHDQSKIDALGISKYAGTYSPRKVRGSATKWSNHAFGAAIDLNAEQNGFNTGKGTMPLPVIAAFKSEGFSWGGDYKSRTDPMHFEACDRGEPKRTFDQWLTALGAKPSKSAAVLPVFSEDFDDAPAPAVPAAPEVIPPKPPSLTVPAQPAPADKNVPKGDPDIWNTQRRLEAMKYFPGDWDGKWGGNTGGAITGFINDRGLSMTAPTSPEMFTAIYPDLKTELAKAEAEGFTRPIAADRADATDAKVAMVSAAIPAAKQNGILAWILGIPATLLTFFSGVASFFKDLWDNDMVVQAREFASDNIGIIAGAVALFAVYQWITAQRAKNATKDAYKEGRLS